MGQGRGKNEGHVVKAPWPHPALQRLPTALERKSRFLTGFQGPVGAGLPFNLTYRNSPPYPTLPLSYAHMPCLRALARVVLSAWDITLTHTHAHTQPLRGSLLGTLPAQLKALCLGQVPPL